MTMELVYPGEIAPVLRGSDTASASEMLPVVDANGVVCAQASRRYCHGGNRPLHPVVHLHIVNRDGHIYLQQRSADKDLLPLRWDTAVGGHVSYGEYIIEALYREAYEELHFSGFNPIAVCSYVFESDIERELVSVFAAVGNFSPEPDGEEVIAGRYWTPAEIGETMGKGVFTPNFESEFRRIAAALQALL